MKIGSLDHKELFCRSFMESYREYEPEKLPWPDLNDTELTLLRSIPFWDQALKVESEAGVLVSSYVANVSDPLIRAAIELQGQEEFRHARLIKTLIDGYSVKVMPVPPVELPRNIEPAFITFGFEECLDSFFAFGLFGLAREAGIFPEQMFTIFDPILDEEARHIVFFVNWFTYIQIERGQRFLPLQLGNTLWYYSQALGNLINAFGKDDPSHSSFTAIGARAFTDNLTPEKFLSFCIRENEYRMSKFDSRLLQPRLLPRIASIALRLIKLVPQHKPQVLESTEMV